MTCALSFFPGINVQVLNSRPNTLKCNVTARQVAKSKKGPNRQCMVDGLIGIGNHISHYLLPILNTFNLC